MSAAVFWGWGKEQDGSEGPWTPSAWTPLTAREQLGIACRELPRRNETRKPAWSVSLRSRPTSIHALGCLLGH